MSHKAISKYLSTYAHTSARVGAALNGHYVASLVIPAYGESETLDKTIESIPTLDHGAVLGVLVVNQRPNSPPSIAKTNRATIARLRERYSPRTTLADGIDRQPTAFGDLIVLNVTLPEHEGVGLARKIGTDFALAAWSKGSLRSPWIHGTDADVVLPNDYFTAINDAAPAVVHRFRHQSTLPHSTQYVRLYDLWLRLHVCGLRFAGSPYAFHTIGSTITVRADSYAAVRGFPRRTAAEDFYLLNKLAKLGDVQQAPSSPIQIMGRPSNRVAFGTGKAISDMLAFGYEAAPRFYHPITYRYLKCLLDAFDCSTTTAHFCVYTLQRRLADEGLDARIMNDVLNALELPRAIRHRLKSSTNPAVRRRAVHGWFDALKTLKFIHALRDRGLENMHAHDALETGQFLLQQTDPSIYDDISVINESRSALICRNDLHGSMSPQSG